MRRTRMNANEQEVLLSHIVTIKTQVKDAAAVAAERKWLEGNALP